jgi:hypothetical protein
MNNKTNAEPGFSCIGYLMSQVTVSEGESDEELDDIRPNILIIGLQRFCRTFAA